MSDTVKPKKDSREREKQPQGQNYEEGVVVILRENNVSTRQERNI